MSAESLVLAWCRNRDRKLAGKYVDGCPVMRENDAYGSHRCFVMDVNKGGGPLWHAPGADWKALRPDDGGIPSRAHIVSGPSWEAVAASLGLA